MQYSSEKNHIKKANKLVTYTIDKLQLSSVNDKIKYLAEYTVKQYIKRIQVIDLTVFFNDQFLE